MERNFFKGILDGKKWDNSFEYTAAQKHLVALQIGFDLLRRFLICAIVLSSSLHVLHNNYT